MDSPVVFVPGFMQRGAAWEQVASRVRERYPSVLFDSRAPTFGERVAELEAVAGEGSVLVGYSYGGRVVLHTALRAPRRFGALVLVGTTAGMEDAEQREQRRRADEELAAWIERSSIEQVVERWEKLPVFATQGTDLMHAQREGRLSHDPADLASLLRTGGQGELEPVWDELPRLDLPVLCLAGELDERYRSEAQRMAESLSNGCAEVVAGSGHAPQLERPGPTAQLVLDFLERELQAG